MLQRITAWVQSLSPVYLGVAGVVILVLFVGGSLFAYRTYDHSEQDNTFCLSCHFMNEPYERFARSGHRDLTCQACHTTNFATQSQMALSQVVDGGVGRTAHAEVPNDRCASCHIDGDPEKWQQVANTAGHKVHLESDQPELEGLQCVQCHGSALHEFATSSETCSQSGCHTDSKVTLGRMGDFQIHCAACHAFQVPLEPGAPLEAETVEGEMPVQGPLVPGQNECMSCHVMRTLVDMPPDEPHGQACAACHNPHEQTTAGEAAETCASAGCHSDAAEVSVFHQGLAHSEVQNCVNCHVAHDWKLDGDDCLSCHTGIYDDDPTARPPGSDPTPVAGGDGAGAVGAVAALDGLYRAPFVRLRDAGVARYVEPGWTTFAGVGMPPSAVAAGQLQDTLRFRHSQHRPVECADCHSSEQLHGQIVIDSRVDCRSCHHTPPNSSDCATCHAPQVLNPVPLVANGWLMTFSTEQRATRDVGFLHEDHTDAECGTCHIEGLDQPFEIASCDTCHEEHHQEPDVADCVACHATPLEGAHDLESHLTCTGAGCHENPPLQVVPRTNNGCLVCHQDMADHEPQEACVACHALPDVAAGRGPGGGHP